MEFGVQFLTLGGLLVLGLALDQIGRSSAVPRVTLLLAAGVALGALELLPRSTAALYQILSVLALTMVAFLLGGALSFQRLREHGPAILWVSAGIVVATLVFVAGGMLLLGLPLALALLLGAIATATAPAATLDVIRQSGRTGPFTQLLREIVAIDDAWGLIVFSLALVAAGVLTGVSASQVFGEALRELFGGIALGVVLGLPASSLTGRIREGEPLVIEAIALVLLIAGGALLLEVSFLIAGMTAGAVVVNLAQHHSRPFREIEHIQPPFLIIFFLLAGATLDLAALAEIGWIGAAFAIFRICGRIAGGWAGALTGGLPPAMRHWIGPALLPQAGIAVGMALVAAQRFPDYAATLVTLTVGTTVLFELIGPSITLWAIRNVEPDPPDEPGDPEPS